MIAKCSNCDVGCSFSSWLPGDEKAGDEKAGDEWSGEQSTNPCYCRRSTASVAESSKNIDCPSIRWNVDVKGSLWLTAYTFFRYHHLFYVFISILIRLHSQSSVWKMPALNNSEAGTAEAEPLTRLPFEPITKSHILNCSYDNWHAKYGFCSKLFVGKLLTYIKISVLNSQISNHPSHFRVPFISTGRWHSSSIWDCYFSSTRNIQQQFNQWWLGWRYRHGTWPLRKILGNSQANTRDNCRTWWISGSQAQLVCSKGCHVDQFKAK